MGWVWWEEGLRPCAHVCSALGGSSCWESVLGMCEMNDISRMIIQILNEKKTASKMQVALHTHFKGTVHQMYECVSEVLLHLETCLVY